MAASSAAARMSGIDVSHFQQEIDWLQVKRMGVAFAFIKATEGLNIFDGRFNQNWRNAERGARSARSVSLFSPATRCEAQARYFLRKSRGDPGELPPVLTLR